uniref:Uncharacterized protein n=1 Tax=Erpetoichthys calabaricus TaxID=27687 RepID=A0A8C4T3B8_ERPCA
MTTTATFQVIDLDAKSSSRVLQPPGGKEGRSLGIFGSIEPYPPYKKKYTCSTAQFRCCRNFDNGGEEKKTPVSNSSGGNKPLGGPL